MESSVLAELPQGHLAPDGARHALQLLVGGIDDNHAIAG